MQINLKGSKSFIILGKHLLKTTDLMKAREYNDFTNPTGGVYSQYVNWLNNRRIWSK